MKKLLLIIALSIGLLSIHTNASANMGVLGPVPYLVTVLTVRLMAQNEGNISTCYTEANKLVAWKNNPNGYSFNVTSCDYQANKSKYVTL